MRVTFQPLFSEEILARPYYEIIGVDTLLFNYQKARHVKDWKKADEIKDIGKKMGYNLSYCKTHYELHDFRENAMESFQKMCMEMYKKYANS